MTTTTTAQNIIDEVQADTGYQLINTPQTLKLVSRIQVQMLRASAWRFLLSDVKSFVTEKGRTDYWIGTNAGCPAGAVNTGLNLSDMFRIDPITFVDRSNYKQLDFTEELPLISTLIKQDGTPFTGRPKQFRQDLQSPYLLSLYPSPDNQNGFQPDAPTANPSSTAGGALAQRTYAFQLTLVDTLGNESSPSDAVTQLIPANTLAVVTIPPSSIIPASTGVAYDRYNVYAAVDDGSTLTLQNLTPVSIASAWTESVGGLSTSGASAPTTNALAEMGGYLIQFRYFKTRQAVTTAAQVLQIPDDYRDVVCAGVAWMMANQLKKYDDSALWRGIYQVGLRDIVRDKNLLIVGDDYIGPDPACQSYATY